LDIDLFVERFPAVGEEVSVERLQRVPGGKGANVAVAAARILGRGEAALIGGLGRDSIARDQLRTLEEEGVETSGLKVVEGEESGQAYIVVDREGRNVIHTLFGANLAVLPGDLLDGARRSLLEEARAVAIVDPPIETIEAMAEMARGAGKTVLWDPGVRSSLGVSRLGRALRNVDYLVANEVEVARMVGESDPVSAGERILGAGEGLKVIVKMGERGCAIVGEEGTMRVAGMPLARMGLRAVNTVGCGDAFLGVFSSFKALGLEDREALYRANAAGAYKATRRETRGSPHREELERFMEAASGLAGGAASQ